MSKNIKNLIICIFISILISLSLFSCAYYLLATHYIKSENINFLYSCSETSSINLNESLIYDYGSCERYINDNIKLDSDRYIVEIEYEKYINNKDKIAENFKKQIEVKVGYFLSDNESLVLDDGKKYLINKNSSLEYITKNIFICNISLLVDEIDETSEYIFFRFNQIFVYFDLNDYFSNVFINPSTNISNYCLLFDETGYIYASYSTGNKEYTNKLKSNLYSNISSNVYNYSDIKESIKCKESGTANIKMCDIDSLFIYFPLLSSFDQNLFIGYVFASVDVKNNNGYMYSALIALSVATVTIITIIVSIFCYSFYKKNQDIANCNNYHYIKPFSIFVDKKGKIKKFNKSVEKNIKNFNKYRSIKEFTIFESFEDVMSIVKKQESFVVEFDSKTKENDVLYARFVPLHMHNKYVLIGSDVTSETKQQIFNKKAASYNQITDLPNKNILDNDITEVLKNPDYENKNISLLGVDLLDFAKINKLYGYDTANFMLKSMSHILNEETKRTFSYFSIYNIRTSFFVILIKNVDNYNKVIMWSRSTASKLSEPIEVKNNFTISVEPRIGIVNLTSDVKTDLTAAKLFDYLEKSVEKSKLSSLSKVSLFNMELSKALSRDQLMEQDLRKGIDEDEFTMFFQPQFNIKTNKIVGFEALLRWNNPKYKFESPEYYVNLAEKNGLIMELGRLINNKVFNFAKKLEGTGISISLNVSAVQLLQAGFAYELIKSYDEHHIKENFVALEITETFLMENRESIITKLRILKEKGFSIHLDDFGIGYSSMFYLKDFPVDAIKIDKEFTKYMVSDKTTRIIVSKIVQIGQSLNLETICEGVENDKQKEALSHIGCDVIQGYLISEAVSTQEALKLIKDYNKIDLLEQEESDYDYNRGNE